MIKVIVLLLWVMIGNRNYETKFDMSPIPILCPCVWTIILDYILGGHSSLTQFCFPPNLRGCFYVSGCHILGHPVCPLLSRVRGRNLIELFLWCMFLPIWLGVVSRPFSHKFKKVPLGPAISLGLWS